MGSVVRFAYASEEHLALESDGHYHLNVPTFYEFGTFRNNPINFIFDTGSFLTVLTRNTAMRFGFLGNYTIRANITLTGFAGGCYADLKRIPGFVVGGRHMEGVVAAVPRVDTDINILGLNVIEAFTYLIDASEEKIYFSWKAGDAIPESLRCTRVYELTP